MCSNEVFTADFVQQNFHRVWPHALCIAQVNDGEFEGEGHQDKAGSFIGKEQEVHTLRQDWVTFKFVPDPPHQQLKFFSPKTSFWKYEAFLLDTKFTHISMSYDLSFWP